MNLHKLDDQLSVAGQITPDDVAALAEAGFTMLVANRPDNEQPGQPPMAAIADAAREHGMAWHYLPVQSGNVTDDDADQFSPLLEEADGPILAFCRSGMRCSALWALSRAETHDADELLTIAGQAGYDLTPLRSRLIQRRRG